MNNYITLDAKRYMCPFKKWFPVGPKPATVRRTLAGNSDVTYGPATYTEWEGVIIVPVTPIDGSYGTITTFRVTAAKLESVAMTDHYGNNYTVHVLGDFREESLSPMWDGANNEFHIPVRVVAE